MATDLEGRSPCQRPDTAQVYQRKPVYCRERRAVCTQLSL